MINDSIFGIEIETCVCDEKLNKIFDIDRFNEYYKNKLNKLSKKDTFIRAEPHVVTLYDKWMITTDDSISCSEPPDDLDIEHKFFYKINKRKSSPVKKCIFYGLEIVSPKIRYIENELIDFLNIYNKTLLHEDFLYEVHESQGLHVNISHPLQNKHKFLQFWWYFEPLLMLFVDENRRNSEYAVPLRKLFPTFEDIDDWKKLYENPKNEKMKKYCAVSVKEDRFEIRFINSDISSEHVMLWVIFLIEFLIVTITKDLFIHDSYNYSSRLISSNKTTANLFDELFDDYIQNDHLKNEFNTKYFVINIL